MKLGLITDIHENVEQLRTALQRLQAAGVDQIVVIGDVFETGERIAETCRLLAEANAVGVWGNHDFGLCFEPDPEVQAKYPAMVVDYMGTLKPHLEIEGCLFTHVEPWLNAESVADLWYFDGPPDSPEKLARIFAATDSRLMFAGHYHIWLAATPEYITDWMGITPIVLDNGRYFIVIGALCEGSFATFDTATLELIPLRTEIL